MGYKQLDYLKRCQIYALWRAGNNQTEIAREVGVHKSTISRELKRNITFVRTKLGSWQYKPGYAQTYADERRKNKHKFIKFNKAIEDFVCDKIQQEWSPEQIAGYAKRHNIFSISHERIYQYILEDKHNGGFLYQHLRHRHKKYRKRYGSPKLNRTIRNRRFIDERPSVVDKKSRIGDWEIDTIVGKDKKQTIISIVERKSKFTVLAKSNTKKSSTVAALIISALKPYLDRVHTITSDNGGEFARHEKISDELEADFYFAHPYSSWERGVNENTNGLIRQYLKKGSSFHQVEGGALNRIMGKLNRRPRKSLGFLTPNEVFLCPNG